MRCVELDVRGILEGGGAKKREEKRKKKELDRRFFFSESFEIESRCGNYGTSRAPPTRVYQTYFSFSLMKKKKKKESRRTERSSFLHLDLYKFNF